MTSTSVPDFKRHAREHFEKWSATYDRSFLNELVFFPAVRACQTEIARWQQTRNGTAVQGGSAQAAPSADGPRAARSAYRALDVGCGTGKLLTILARDPDAEMLVGLDYSPAMVRAVSEKTRQLQLHSKLHAVHGDSERLPLADESFDVITCCHSFHHYPHQATAIREFHRVLRPGGTAILIDGFRDNVIGWVVFDVAVAWVEKHVHHASWTEVRRMFESAGFRRVTQRKMNVLAPLLITIAAK